MEFLKVLAEFRTPLVDRIMLIISDLGTPVAIFVIIGWIYLNVNKKNAYKMGVSLYFSLIVAQGMKLIFRIPRPWVLNPDFHASGIALSTATGYSFPSVHTQSTESFGTSVFLTNKKHSVRNIALIMMILVPFSRMWLGCHTPLDVSVGAAVGIGTTVLVGTLWTVHNGRLDGILIIFLFAFSGILLLIGGFLTWNGSVDFLLAKDSFESAGITIGFAAGCLFEQKLVRFQNRGTKLQKGFRFVLALTGVLIIEVIGRMISNTSAVSVTVRYALIGFFMTGIAPWLCVRLGLLQREEE